MKKILNIFVFTLTLLVVQSCGSKSDKNNEAYAANNTLAVKPISSNTLTLAEKRAKIAKQRAMQAEKRRIAYDTWCQSHPTFTDSDGNLIYSKSEVAPSYVGGEETMEKYLNEHINYPKEASDYGFEGTVFIDFIVDTQGVVREVVATDEAGENVDQSLRDEAVRLVLSMPNWNPGRQHGKAVQVKYSLPVTFKLS